MEMEVCNEMGGKESNQIAIYSYWMKTTNQELLCVRGSSGLYHGMYVPGILGQGIRPVVLEKVISTR